MNTIYNAKSALSLAREVTQYAKVGAELPENLRQELESVDGLTQSRIEFYTMGHADGAKEARAKYRKRASSADVCAEANNVAPTWAIEASEAERRRIFLALVAGISAAIVIGVAIWATIRTVQIGAQMQRTSILHGGVTRGI